MSSTPPAPTASSPTTDMRLAGLCLEAGLTLAVLGAWFQVVASLPDSAPPRVGACQAGRAPQQRGSASCAALTAKGTAPRVDVGGGK
jgi:hypothetical protein